MTSPPAAQPIGVFDSGIGGLSVLQALRHELLHEHFVYLADSGNAPYGDAKGDAFVQQRTLAIAGFLRQRHDIKALVVACNTATAAAVEQLRAAMPDLPVIGVEPALKPAAACSQTHHVGVLATRGTVSSARFARLRNDHSARTHFAVQACDGLARAIEQSTEEPLPAAASAAKTGALCAQYTGALGRFGLKTGEIDTLVLGCTHYVFAKDVLRALVGPDVQILDTGAPVARQTRRILTQAGTLAPEQSADGQPAAPGRVQLYTTGQLGALQAAAERWLGLPAQYCAALPPGLQRLRWDIFCQVIDNFGDIGVCWRLAADLGARGHAVRLWVDDASALAWMAPQASTGGAPGVQVLPWPTQAPADGPGDVVVEAFGCEIAPQFIAAIAHSTGATGIKPLWINLEYLSAEGYVERCHGLPSPLMSGPAKGLTRWFFYPGFTESTGGLPREPDLLARQAAFDRPAWRARHGVAPGDCAISLFCYEPPALPGLLAQLRRRADARLLVTPGRAAAAVGGWQRQNLSQNGLEPLQNKREQLSISYLPPCPQPAFDEMLWACDLNFVRGEDSLVRALWAGQPFVWQIYPQHDDAHHAKLLAFLDWLQAPASLRRWSALWNGLESVGELPALDAATLAEWRACVVAARRRLLGQQDLLTSLLGFVSEKS